jgi:Big-like domain-containing protein
MIDMMMLIESQQPDAKGNTVPPAVTAGSAIIESAAGRKTPVTLVVAGSTFNVQTATCGTVCINCCGYASFVVNPSNAYCPVGMTMGCSLQGTDCNGGTATFSANWTSSNTAVATINSSGVMTGVAPGSVTITGTVNSFIEVTQGQICSGSYPVCPTGEPGGSAPESVVPDVSVTGPHEVPLVGPNLLPGTTGINRVSLSSNVNPAGGTYSWTTPDTNKVSLNYTSGPTITVTSVSASTSLGDVTISLKYTYNTTFSNTASTFMTVQQPTYLSLASNISSGPASCPSAETGPDRRLNWQVEDQFTGAIQFDNMPQYDNIGWQGANGCNPPGNTNGCNSGGFATGSGFTNPSGQFPDHYAMCSTCCDVGISCTTTANQYYYVNGFQILKNPKYSCSGITINGQ